MLRTSRKFSGAFVAACLLALAAVPTVAQVDDQLLAKRRVFPTIGPGLRALHHADGKYYLLASPGVGVAIFDSAEKQIAVVGAPNAAGHAVIAFGEDCDIDAQGNIYVADRGNNLIQVFAPDGKLLRSISFNSPVSIAALPEGEVAVTAPRGLHLVTVFGANGRLVREFGDAEQLSAREDLNRYLSIGRLASDPLGRLYYGYTYLPEPDVRQYDRFGFAKLDFQFTSIDAFTDARAMRKEIERQEKRADPPRLSPLLTAFGVDPANGDVWVALHNTLLHFDSEGNRRSEYQVYTKDGARLEADALVVEENRLLIGSDPLGVWEFPRPDRKP